MLPWAAARSMKIGTSVITPLKSPPLVSSVRGDGLFFVRRNYGP